MDRIRNLEIFVAVAEQASFVGAARRLHSSAPAVTRAIAALEDHLRASLFTRNSRQVSLTEAGHRLLLRAREILALVAETEREARGDSEVPRGHLTVTASVTFGRMHVTAVLLDFLREHPDVMGSLLLVDRVVNLVEEAVDVAFRIGELPDSSLVARRVGWARLVLVASPSYLERRGSPTHPRDLVDHDILAFRGLMPDNEWRYLDGDSPRRVTLAPRLEVNDAASALVGALRGDGVTLALSYLVADDIRSGRLALVLEPFLPAPVPIHMVTAETRLQAARVRRFLDFCAPRIAASLG